MGVGLKVELILRNGCQVSKLTFIATFGALFPRTNSLGSQLPLTSDWAGLSPLQGVSPLASLAPALHFFSRERECGSLHVTGPHNLTVSDTTTKCDLIKIDVALPEEVCTHCGDGF